MRVIFSDRIKNNSFKKCYKNKIKVEKVPGIEEKKLLITSNSNIQMPIIHISMDLLKYEIFYNSGNWK